MAHRFSNKESLLRRKGYFCIAGIDEVGRGPLAGPVVSAAVILKLGTKLPGLNDSKKLTKKKREILFEQITQKSLDFAISFVPPTRIDKINILNATLEANCNCIKSLKIKPDYIVIDGRDKQKLRQKHETIIKGDQKLRCIAAASILAKVARDKLMEQYHNDFPVYGFNKHMGYGTRQHAQNIREFGQCEIHRKSFTLKK
ncbi:ribonuclease HII [Patescibacteria group bacterium]|nr:ribonuclease HII [Patescibacteria group bacterium]